MTELWRCEEALMGNCQRESCGGFNWHPFDEKECGDNNRKCGNTQTHWNQLVAVRCVKKVEEKENCTTNIRI